MVRAKMGVWAVASLIYIVAVLIIEAILFGILYAMGLFGQASANPSFASIAAQLVVNLIILAATAYFQAGFIRMALKQVRGQEIQTNDLFSAGDVTGPAIVTQLVYGIATYIGTLLCIIPGLIVAGRGMLAMPLTVDRGEAGIGAFQKSWEALKNDTLNAVLFLFAAAIVSSLGALACGIGAIFTAPIFPLALAITYRDFFDTESGLRGPTLDMPLPPQSAYGTPPAPPSSTDAPGQMGQL